ncbi:putative cytochrome C oxidase subunit IIa [Cardiosporidium cionae]|uniref:Cytochrome C oxidase subunit IIa n=1 Tax=Cardiosporidium cionae TaxID=476202 RepID=A0ABQ7JBM7_9APIC|nr:putative cytochrome C oxidase subunit IIa [Cardiosporidium cionae]|eukprot:KAF8821398.1 putative cytochrome C oxidase subunit IIa [Cardiosporidium cionae]
MALRIMGFNSPFGRFSCFTSSSMHSLLLPVGRLERRCWHSCLWDTSFKQGPAYHLQFACMLSARGLSSSSSSKDVAAHVSTSNSDHDVSAHHDEKIGFYHMPAADHAEDSHHGDPRQHLWEDGTTKWGLSSDHFHWYDVYRGTPEQLTTTVNGVKMLKGVETRPLDELYCVSQDNMPFWPRTRLNFWGNHSLGLKAEFLFFWIPTLIIASLAIPCLTMVYMNDETVFNTMTIKVVGRQWYWIYEVESPPEDEEE